MPAGVMVILVVHCLRDLPVTPSRAMAPPTALAVTVGLYLWRRNALLSLLAGTAVHVALPAPSSPRDPRPAAGPPRP